MKNIMIVLEKLDIGGVETAVYNQTLALIELGYKVVILAKKGIYTEDLENRGAICINFEFSLNNNIDIEKTKEIVEIIKKYEIDEVHINQFPCILSAMPACVITNTPYIAYSHVGIKGTYEWYITTYNLYENIFKFFYENANKIVAITENAKNEIIDNFGINKDKIDVVKNSIDFSIINQIDVLPVKEINNMLIISRISNEKEKSIKNAIDLFVEYAKTNENAKLTIIGDGNIREEIERYVEATGIKEKIDMIGAKNNVLEYINKNDVVIGLDRCILEAIAMKRIAIISGYENLKKIIKGKIIQKASSYNFSGGNLEDSTKEEIINELNNLSPEDIVEMTEINYNYVFKNCNIRDNLRFVESKFDNEKAVTELLEMIVDLQEKRIDGEEKVKEHDIEINKKNELIDNQNKEIEMLKNDILSKKNEEIEALKKELKEVYNSKRWKITEKIAKVLHL